MECLPAMPQATTINFSWQDSIVEAGSYGNGMLWISMEHAEPTKPMAIAKSWTMPGTIFEPFISDILSRGFLSNSNISQI